MICAEYMDACFSADDINDGTWFAGSGQGEHSLYADPSFVDAVGRDLHLQAGSPAVNAGTSDGAPPFDLESQPRDSAPDIWGAGAALVGLRKLSGTFGCRSPMLVGASGRCWILIFRTHSQHWLFRPMLGLWGRNGAQIKRRQ